MTDRVKQTLSTAESRSRRNAGKPLDDAVLGVLGDVLTRLQTQLTSSGIHGQSRLSVPGVSIRVTTAKQTQIERVLDALLKNRTTFV